MRERVATRRIEIDGASNGGVGPQYRGPHRAALNRIFRTYIAMVEARAASRRAAGASRLFLNRGSPRARMHRQGQSASAEARVPRVCFVAVSCIVRALRKL